MGRARLGMRERVSERQRERACETAGERGGGGERDAPHRQFPLWCIQESERQRESARERGRERNRERERQTERERCTPLPIPSMVYPLLCEDRVRDGPASG